MTDTSTRLDDALYYGYDPGCPRAGLPDSVADAARGSPLTADYERQVSMAQEAFRAAVEAELAECGADTHLVPLSAGLDSRAILATLLDVPDVAPADVHTVTFGTPGTWDFEIGKRVAAAAGVGNTAVDLRPGSFDWSLQSLRAYARTASHPIRMLEGYANARAATIAGDSAVWSGFLGGTTTGQHVHESPRETWDGAVESFARANHYTNIDPPAYDPRAPLPDEPYVPQTALPYTNQLSFAHRQQCYIGPVVLGDGPRQTPFAREEWLEFMLNVPRRHRAQRGLFVDAMIDAFPDLFALPTDANAGFPLWVSDRRRKLRTARLRLTHGLASRLGLDYTHPGTNYLDFARAFRREGELRETASTLLSGFRERDPAGWLDPREIWSDHQNGADRSRDIKVLCSLELYLESASGSELDQPREFL
jgi:hypothetical protein